MQCFPVHALNVTSHQRSLRITIVISRPADRGITQTIRIGTHDFGAITASVGLRIVHGFVREGEEETIEGIGAEILPVVEAAVEIVIQDSDLEVVISHKTDSDLVQQTPHSPRQAHETEIFRRAKA